MCLRLILGRNRSVITARITASARRALTNSATAASYGTAEGFGIFTSDRMMRRECEP